jgi:hypothetical protein
VASHPVNPGQRATDYTVKLVPANVNAALTARLPSMRAAMHDYLPTEASIRAKIGSILAPHAIPPHKLGQYMAAGLQMWSKARRLPGGAVAEVGYVIATWVSRGLSATYLASIRDIITGVPAP